MWTQYRKWKHLLTFPLVLLGLVLMRGHPGESARWYIGMTIAVLLGGAYLCEEIVWIVKNRGRPCPSCGRGVRLKPFMVRLRCPHCGRILE
jgi:hypothetical protein